MTEPNLLEHDSSAYNELLARIVGLSQGWRTADDREDRRAPLESIWRDLEATAAPPALPKSMVEHLLADLQSDPAKELHWDLESVRSLSSIWLQTADPRLFDAACRCLPSYYLSLACASRSCADMEAAREYLRRARLILPVLPDSRYAQELTRAIDKLGRMLARVDA